MMGQQPTGRSLDGAREVADQVDIDECNDSVGTLLPSRPHYSREPE